MKNTPWVTFFESKVHSIFKTQKEVIDIGGGLRVLKENNNRFNNDNYEKFHTYLKDVQYKIMDPVPDYNPHIIGDIHKMPFESASIEAILCLAVLEHVEDPIRAVDECYRVMKEGGKGMFYMPFLYYYHAEIGYYKDYWRFTNDGCEYLFKKFSHVEICAVRGRYATFGRLAGKGFFEKIGFLLDQIFPKKTKQVSGYYVYVEK